MTEVGATEARALVQSGTCVVTGDVLEEERQRLARRRERSREQLARLLRAPQRDRDWERTVAVTNETFGRLTILASNAGVSGRVGLEKTLEEGAVSKAPSLRSGHLNEASRARADH